MRCLVCVILLLLLNALEAQEPNITYTHLSPRDGLAGAQVYCAFQDRQGYIWFGTETGVSRYNGRRFDNFYTGDGLSDNEVFLMFQDSKDRIWFSTLNGQPSYYLNGEFHNTFNTAWLKDLSLGAHFGSFYEDTTGNLWFAVQRKGVVRIAPDGNVMKHDFGKAFNGQLLSFKEKEEQVWIGHSLYGEINLSILAPGEDIILEDTEQTTTKEDIDRYIAEGTPMLVNGKHMAKTYLEGVEFNKDYVDMTKIQRYGQEIWLSTYKGAYQLINGALIKSRFFEDKIVTHVLKDREEGYWFTTLGDGVYWSSSIASKTFTNEESEVLDGVSVLHWDGEQLVFGGPGAVVGHLAQGKVGLTQAAHFINRSMIKTIEKGDQPGQYILGSDNMLIEVIKGKVTRQQEINAKVVKRIGEGLWAIGTGSSLSVHNIEQLNYFLNITGKEFKQVSPEQGKGVKALYLFPESVWVTDIAAYKDGFLASTLSGIYQFDKDYNFKLWTHPEWNDRRVSDIAVFENNEDFILATYGFGVSIFRNGKMTNITSKNGLLSDLCRKVLIEDEDHVWVATNRGISQLTWNGTTWDITSVRRSDGLGSEDVYDLALTDQLVAATSSGLSFINRETLGKAKVRPLINIREIASGNELFRTDSLQKPYSRDELKISYEGVHYSSLDNLSYRYRVLGLNEQWTATENTALNLVRLSPGTYHFEVQAVSHHGLISDTAKVVLVVTAPFWWTWWFISLCGLVIVLLTVTLMRRIIRKNRVKAQREMEMQLKMSENEIKLLKAQMKPHFTYNILNSIQSLILKQDTQKAYEMIGEFAGLMRKDLNAYDQTVIALDEELRLLETYLKLEQSRFDEGSWTFHIAMREPLNPKEIGVPPMIIQPFAENSLKHAFSGLKEKGQLNIQVEVTDDWLEIKVNDNGPGLKERLNGLHQSKGIEIVRKRLKLVDERNSVVVENTREGRGVEAHLKIKTLKL